MTVKWNFDGQRPIYAQITGQLRAAIASGALAAGERLPTVRELAATAGVNPNTVQRAMAELEREGLVHALRTSGRYITEDAALIDELRERLAREEVAAFLEKMRALGLSDAMTEEIVKKELTK